MVELQLIYLSKIDESLARVAAAETFLVGYEERRDVFALEAAMLQMRKALESMAFAAIAPNKVEYVKLRKEAENARDFRKDYSARKIVQALKQVNPDFYPVPVAAPSLIASKQWHFDRRHDDSLTQDRFETLYDRLGKFLHADNPWGHDKGYENIAKELPGVISAIRLLLSLHFVVIRAPAFQGIWVVESFADGRPSTVLTGQAAGDFVVQHD